MIIWISLLIYFVAYNLWRVNSLAFLIINLLIMVFNFILPLRSTHNLFRCLLGWVSTSCRSTLCYCVFFFLSLLSWFSKRHHTVSRSSAESEYWGVANVVGETAWLRNLLQVLHAPLLLATIVYCNNLSVVYMSSNQVQYQQTKDIENDIHFVRDKVATSNIQVPRVPSHYRYANIFTKGLPLPLFFKFRSILNIRKSSTAQTKGA